MTGHVFISYSRSDKEYVDRLINHLEAFGLEVWVDHELDFGDRWQKVVQEKVDTCAAFVPIMSPAANESRWVEREVLRAEAQGKPIVPLLLAGDQFFNLGEVQYDDVRGGLMPGADFVARLHELMGAGDHPADRRSRSVPLPRTGRIAPRASVAELRVQHIAGTTAEEVLVTERARRVAGDVEAGFYRAFPDESDTPGTTSTVREAYLWASPARAGATWPAAIRAVAVRAAWFLLIPFTLVNLAMWMRPPAIGPGRRVVTGLCRLVAMSLSVAFVFAWIGVSLDLVAWQCAAPGSACEANIPMVGWLFTGFFEPTGRRLGLAALLPLAGVGLLWYAARRTWQRYESYSAPRPPDDGDGLAAPTFWGGRRQVRRLRSLHVATMLAAISLSLLYVLLDRDRGAYERVDVAGVSASTVVVVAGVLEIVAIVLLIGGPILLLVPPMADRVSTSRAADLVATGMLRLAVLITALTLFYAFLPRAPWPTTFAPLPGYTGTVTGLFIAQIGLLAALAVALAFQRHRATGAVAGGFGALVVASLGISLAAALSSSLSYRFADFFDGAAVPSPAVFGPRSGALRLQPPPVYEWSAFVAFVALIVVLLTGLWIRLVIVPRLRRSARLSTDEDYPGGRTRDPARARQIDEATASAQLTDQVVRPLAIAWLVLAAINVVGAGATVFDLGPTRLAESGSTAAQLLSTMVNLGSYLVALFVPTLIFVGIQTYRNSRARKLVGFIWDVATFWPRAGHPLAPPCYAERAVPELTHRATWLATEQAGVVLSGQGQGSLLAAATMLQLPAPAGAQAALLTYGSSLGRLYGRSFPAYLSAGALGNLVTKVSGPTGEPRWINLWRRTDPTGGIVHIDDQRLPDPVTFDPAPGDLQPPPVQGDAGYELAPEFGRAVDDLVDRLARSSASAPAPVEIPE